MFVTNPIGIIGEEAASKLLRKKGYKIVEHNWRLGHLEMDIIAENREEIVFVEVKARTSTYGSRRPEENVDELKKRRMVVAANAYIKLKQSLKSPRFDIVGVMVNPNTQEIEEITHLENAFVPKLRTINEKSYNGSWRWGHRSKVIGKR